MHVEHPPGPRAFVQAFALVAIAAVLIASTGMYYLEHEAQPEKFSSVPESMYWAITTLTTVGYGDITPHSITARLFTASIIILGITVFATSISAATLRLSRRAKA